jgi:hypothetical protein
VHIQELGRIDTGGRAEALGEDVEVLERAQVAEVKDRPEVHVEPFGALAGEDLAAVGERVDGTVGQRRGVVRRRQRADVAGRAEQAPA